MLIQKYYITLSYSIKFLKKETINNNYQVY
jgi:hypothetical protein